MRNCFTRKGIRLPIYLLLAACLFFASAFNEAYGQCYGDIYVGGGGPEYIGGPLTCSGSSSAVPSTGYLQFDGVAGVYYTFQLSGGSWSAYDMTYMEWNGSTWVVQYNSGGTNPWTIKANTTSPSGGGYSLLKVLNGTGYYYSTTDCQSAWITNSATLAYKITPATTPAITQVPASGGHVCVGNGVTYTASGMTYGNFSEFLYGWGGSGTNVLSTTNPYTWTSNISGGTSLYVYAVNNNGGCTANSSVVNVTMDALSSTGSFVSTLYSCGSGSTYNTSGTLTAQSITGYSGTILGWGYGSSGTCASDNTAYPANAGNATCPWTTIPGSNTTLMVEVQNGVCNASQSCYVVTANTLTAPTGASVSPSNVCAGYSGNITLTYTGGGSSYLPATLKWYSGSCNGTLVGTGQSLVISAPSSTTTYYCAWVDPCGTVTACQSATFTVTALPTVSAASYSICKGSTTTLSPSSGGTWVSNNTSVATVSGNTVTGVGAGSTTFTFTSSTSPNCSNTTASVSVTSLPTVSITGPTSFCGGTTTTLSPTSGGTWASNNTAVATVSGYTVTGTSAGGTTNFTFTSSTSPNCSNSTSVVTVTGLPTVYGVTGGGTYCYGSSSVVGLSGSQTNVNYQLVLNGSTNVGSPVAGTGSALSFGGQTAVGTYTVVATTVTNSCTQSMSGNAVVNELSPNLTNNPGATSIGTNGATLNGTD